MVIRAYTVITPVKRVMILQWRHTPFEQKKTETIIDGFSQGKLSFSTSLEQLRQLYDERFNRFKGDRFGVTTSQFVPRIQGKTVDAYGPAVSSQIEKVHPILSKDQLLAPLHALIGLSEVKRSIDELYAYLAVQALRQEAGLKLNQTVLHMIFSGRPGTGKTTVARLLGPLLCALGVLSQGHVVEVERADLVGEYIGHTAQKTRALMEQAMGGILFVDEAYAIARGGEKDFGREAIDTLVKGMEDRKHDLIVILAGYEVEMNYFLSLNPGLSSRFPLHVFFPDYSEQELLQIATGMVRERQYHLSPDATMSLRQQLRHEQLREDFSNARTVRNIVERAIRRQAVRIMEQHEPTRRELMTLVATDFRGETDHESLYSDRATKRWEDFA